MLSDACFDLVSLLHDEAKDWAIRHFIDQVKGYRDDPRVEPIWNYPLAEIDALVAAANKALDPDKALCNDFVQLLVLAEQTRAKYDAPPD